MRNHNIELVSYKLCPYVQRAVITLIEKDVEFERINIDLSKKPKWFAERSPTGKVPLLIVDRDTTIFESAVICEYLDETTGGTLLPQEAKLKATHRSWIEFASQILDIIGKYYGAKTEADFNKAYLQLRTRFERLEDQIALPYFAGTHFMMVDAACAPVFRYFDVFDRVVQSDLFDGLEKLNSWRRALSARASVKEAVAEDFAEGLIEFVVRKQSYLSRLVQVNRKI